MNKEEYKYGEIKNPVTDGALEGISKKIIYISVIKKRIEQLDAEIIALSNDIAQTIAAAERHGYTDKEIAETIGPIYTI